MEPNKARPAVVMTTGRAFSICDPQSNSAIVYPTNAPPFPFTLGSSAAVSLWPSSWPFDDRVVALANAGAVLPDPPLPEGEDEEEDEDDGADAGTCTRTAVFQTA